VKLKSSRVFLEGMFAPAAVAFEGGVITYIGDDDSGALDLGDSLVVPGFIDAHTHGAYGASANYSSKEEILRWKKRLPEEGVTSFLPTTFTESDENQFGALALLADLSEEESPGADILGIHMEGPFVGHPYKGAMREEMIQKPDAGKLTAFLEKGRGHVKYITIACEDDDDFRTIAAARAAGVTVTVGHSAASFRTALLALANGASCFTHAFNAMSPLRHRAAGVAGAMMRTDAFCEAIFDGNHVHFEVLNLLFRTKGPDRVVGVSDSLALKGAPPGEYAVSGQTVVIHDNGSAYLKGTDTLAGSTLMFHKGLRDLVDICGIPLDWAVKALSCNPAKLLGADGRKGFLRLGYDADIAVLGADYTVKQTYVRGAPQLGGAQ